jgi:deoxyadenosine/deoxycytidine kinase
MRIVIDGNIGSGKTTQILLLKNIGFKTKKEPIDDWPLKEFYEDPSRWAFTLHMKILETYSNAPQNCIYERCMQSVKMVFWYNLVNIKKIVTDIEDKIFDAWYRKVEWTPDINIYLYSHPQKCLERIQTRNQPGDSVITLEYLTQLSDWYQMLKWYNRKNKNYHTIYVDDKTPEVIHNEILSVLISEDAMYISDLNRSQVS